MWQRIQTLYLAIACALTASLFFCNIANVIGADGVVEHIRYSEKLIYLVLTIICMLTGVLSIFTAHGVNMSKLESRPQRGTCWKYIFFADVECDLSDPAYAGLLSEIAPLCTMVRVLGCYPEGPMLDSTSTITDTAS